MNSIQAVVMPQIIFGDISVCTEEYHSIYSSLRLLRTTAAILRHVENTSIQQVR